MQNLNVGEKLSPEMLKQFRPPEAFLAGKPSYLAGSLLRVPNAHSEGTLMVLLPQAAFPGWNVSTGPDGKQAPAGTTPFDQMAEELGEGLPQELVTAAEITAASPELAVATGVAGTLLRGVSELGVYRVADLLREELATASDEPTAGQVLLVAALPEIGLFPAAKEAVEKATQGDEKPRRNLDAFKDPVRTVAYAVENFAERITMLKAMSTPADAILEQALHVEDCIDEDDLIDLLEEASPRTVASWLLGLHRWHPSRSALAGLGTRIDNDRMRQIRGAYQAFVDEGHEASTPWIGDLALNMFVPDVQLSPVAATLVWHRLTEMYTADEAAALAVVTLAGTTDGVVSLNATP